VLAAACSGRLTEDWREGTDTLSDEIETDLPKGWKWIELNTILPKGGIFDGPFGSRLKTSDYTVSGVRVIRLENVGHLNFIADKKTYVSKEKYETLKKHTVGEGDIIFSSFINDEIRACKLPKMKAVAKADCFTLRPNGAMIDKTYLLLNLVCRESFNRLTENIHGVSRPRINTTQLKQLNIRWCNLTEQHEIVRRVENLFKLADSLESKYKKAMAAVEKIEQAILAKAFRGELAAQDPADEPASELLKRIKKEKETAGKGKTIKSRA
jgi:type I restriction enzyme S subunit